mmetsp:Transcript_31922/g.85423  ORF Transcript_31922/g.85423 Transcript_31922/m.85423 type:complete len:146 (+) Transcript_31922:2355-2792(+)
MWASRSSRASQPISWYRGERIVVDVLRAGNDLLGPTAGPSEEWGIVRDVAPLDLSPTFLKEALFVDEFPQDPVLELWPVPSFCAAWLIRWNCRSNSRGNRADSRASFAGRLPVLPLKLEFGVPPEAFLISPMTGYQEQKIQSWMA